MTDQKKKIFDIDPVLSNSAAASVQSVEVLLITGPMIMSINISTFQMFLNQSDLSKIAKGYGTLAPLWTNDDFFRMAFFNLE